MLRVRIIPCLLLDGDRLVKTVKFEKPSYVGDPINTAKIFSEKEVDEIIIVDISASRERREPNYALIGELASECFMPICYGGNVSSVDVAQRLISLGVEKVSINAAALEAPTIITAIANKLGSQSVVASIDYKPSLFGKNYAYSHVARKGTSVPLDELARRYVDAGCGELLINAVHLDGTQKGMDVATMADLSGRISVPLLACGGAGSLEHLLEMRKAGAAGVCAGSLFVYHGPHRAVLVNYPPQKTISNVFGEAYESNR